MRLPCLLHGWHRRSCTKETDLIYEGIATSSRSVDLISLSLKETDLIYEGIATISLVLDPTLLFLKETDLIYEGIATANIHFCCVPATPCKETDLIYEGIATGLRSSVGITSIASKKLT